MFELASLLKETTNCPENFSGNFRCTDLEKIPPNSWSGSTKCPGKFSAVLSVMSLLAGASLLLLLKESLAKFAIVNLNGIFYSCITSDH